MFHQQNYCHILIFICPGGTVNIVIYYLVTICFIIYFGNQEYLPQTLVSSGKPGHPFCPRDCARHLRCLRDNAELELHAVFIYGSDNIMMKLYDNVVLY